eukprot:3690831-Rhodomonas_salina.5
MAINFEYRLPYDPTRCAVLAYRVCYMMLGTNMPYVGGIFYAIPGTDIPYAATILDTDPARMSYCVPAPRCPAMTYAMLLPDCCWGYAPPAKATRTRLQVVGESGPGGSVPVIVREGMLLHSFYAKYSTDVCYAADAKSCTDRGCPAYNFQDWPRLCCHAMSGTDLDYATTTPRMRYAKSGTEIRYAATLLRDIRY